MAKRALILASPGGRGTVQARRGSSSAAPLGIMGMQKQISRSPCNECDCSVILSRAFFVFSSMDRTRSCMICLGAPCFILDVNVKISA